MNPITRVDLFRRMPAGGTSYTAPSTPDRATEIRQAIDDASFGHLGDLDEDMREVYVDRLANALAARESALQARLDAVLALCDAISRMSPSPDMESVIGRIRAAALRIRAAALEPAPGDEEAHDGQ